MRQTAEERLRAGMWVVQLKESVRILQRGISEAYGFLEGCQAISWPLDTWRIHKAKDTLSCALRSSSQVLSPNTDGAEAKPRSEVVPGEGWTYHSDATVETLWPRRDRLRILWHGYTRLELHIEAEIGSTEPPKITMKAPPRGSPGPFPEKRYPGSNPRRRAP